MPPNPNDASASTSVVSRGCVNAEDSDTRHTSFVHGFERDRYSTPLSSCRSYDDPRRYSTTCDWIQDHMVKIHGSSRMLAQRVIDRYLWHVSRCSTFNGTDRRNIRPKLTFVTLMAPLEQLYCNVLRFLLASRPTSC